MYLALSVCALSSLGCRVVYGPPVLSAELDCVPPKGEAWVPRELDKATMTTYRVEPPDILSIDVTSRAAQSTHVLQPGDSVQLMVTGAFPDEPISGEYRIGAGGTIELGFTYGAIEVGGVTVNEASARVEHHLRKQLRDPHVSMSLRGVGNQQRLSGQFVVFPDGTISLGPYGSVSVVGQTLDEIRMTVAEHLSQFFDHPLVSVSVAAFNSKVYYIVMQGGGMGDRLVRFPCTGNETVMDALSQVNGLSYVSSTRMWIARPDRDSRRSQILPIDWEAITRRADVETNYQLMPGDRLYIAHDRWVAFDGAIAKIASPFERLFSFTILGTAAASRLSGNVLSDDVSLLAPVY